VLGQRCGDLPPRDRVLGAPLIDPHAEQIDLGVAEFLFAGGTCRVTILSISRLRAEFDRDGRPRRSAGENTSCVSGGACLGDFALRQRTSPSTAEISIKLRAPPVWRWAAPAAMT
jgi:hypothetical protein